MLTKYPQNNYETVKVSFEKELSPPERDRAVEIAKYWASIFYNGEFKDTWMSDGNNLIVSVKERECSRRHNSLEKLGEFLTVGTMVKQNNERTLAGLGEVVKQIIGIDM